MPQNCLRYSRDANLGKVVHTKQELNKIISPKLKQAKINGLLWVWILLSAPV